MDFNLNREYSFTDKTFLLSPEAAILRSLAESLYPSYLARMYREGKVLHPHSIPALDDHFVRSSEGLWFRVLSETIYTEIMLQQEGAEHTVLMFGSARVEEKDSPGTLDLTPYYQKAQALAEKITRWSLSHGQPGKPQPFLICTGGGPGLMEAGNRGAAEAGGRSIGLNIYLPMEQKSNSYITSDLLFNFQYFFTRKFHFLKRAKAIVVFPGGFGSLDELFEALTLMQTGKIPRIKVILFGLPFWKEIIRMDQLVEYGTIAPDDLNLIEYHDEVEPAFQSLIKELGRFLEAQRAGHHLPLNGTL